MSSGHGSGPEDQQGPSAPADESPQDDQDLEWTAWRSGPGYSRPVPPDPESGAGPSKPGSHEKPAPRHPYQDRVPSQPPPPERRDEFWGPKHSAEPSSSSPLPPEVHEEPRSRTAPRTYEPRAYQAPSPYEEPEGYEVPKPRPYVGTGGYESAGRRGEAGPGGPDEPSDFDDSDRFEEPLDNRPDDADSGPRSQDEKDEYARFWGEGRGGGAHASPQGPARPAAPVPPPPGDTSIYRNPPPKRQVGFLVGVAAVIVAAGIAATFLLTQHSPKKHPAAGGSPSSGTSAPSSSAPPASTPPSVSGASGHLGVPGAIGALRLNSALTGKFVGSSVKKKDADSFFIPDSDVVSGFYTANPAATTFSTRDPRLMFLVAYLSGSGNAHSALHEFMTNQTFTGQQQINPGPKGGVAACGLLTQHNAAPVAHCMWADGDTYADFYSWNTSTSALAKTMIGIRPKVELSR